MNKNLKNEAVNKTTLELIQNVNLDISIYEKKLGGDIVISAVMSMCDHYQLDAIDAAASHLNDSDDANKIAAQNNLSLFKKAFQNNIDYINKHLVKINTSASC